MPFGERQKREREAADVVVVRRSPRRRRVGVRDEQSLAKRPACPRKTAQQVGARLVHEVHVFDHEHRRRACQRRDEEAHRDVGQRLAQEALIEASRLGRAGKIEAEQDAEQRHPRNERRVDARRDLAQTTLHFAGVRLRPEPERSEHRRPERVVRGRRLVLLAARVQHHDVGAAADELLHKPRSAAARRAADLDDPTVSSTHVVEHREERGKLGVTSDERCLDRTLAPRADDGPDDRSPDQLRLALGTERLDGRGLEGRARSLQHDLGREDLPRLGPAHDPRGRIDRVAEDTVGATVRWAEIPGEDLAGVDADPHRDDTGSVHHLTQCAQHPLLVVTCARRRTRGQQRLHAPLADVGLVERHLIAEGGFLDRADALVERLGERFRAEPSEQHVGVHQVDEGGGDRPVLRLAALEQHVGASRDRDALSDVEATDVTDIGSALTLHVGRRDEEQRFFFLRSDARRVEASRERRADADLAGIGACLDGDRLGCGGPGDEQLAMHAAGREELDRARGDPDRHPQRHGPAGNAQPAHAFDRPLHLPGSPSRALWMARPVEEKQERVAAPLEQPGSPVVGLVQKCSEDAVECVPHQLRADLPPSGQVLREGREARDVDEHERSIHGPVPSLRRFAHPFDQEAGHVWLQHLALTIEHRSFEQGHHTGPRHRAGEVGTRGIDIEYATPGNDCAAFASLS